MSEHMSPIPSMIYNAAVGGHVTNSQQIIDEDYNLEQKDINKETLGVPYNAITPNGMGKIVLKKNDNFKQVVEAQTDGNTIFVIKYDFTLTGNVTVPENCIFEFEGGSINAGSGENMDTITGNNTGIVAPLCKIFSTDIRLKKRTLSPGGDGASEWNIPCFYSEWFGAKGDGVADDTDAIQAAINNADLFISGVCCVKLLYNHYYNISSPIRIPSFMRFGGLEPNEPSLSDYFIPTITQTTNGNVIEIYGRNFQTSDSVSRLVISGVHLVGQSKNNGKGIAINSSTSIGFSSMLIENIFIENLKFGIHFDIPYAGWTTNFKNICCGHANVGIGIYLKFATGCWGLNFVDCSIGYTTIGGIYIEAPGNSGPINFTNCYFEGCGNEYNLDDLYEWGSWGLYIKGIGSQIGLVNIDNCYFERNNPARAWKENDLHNDNPYGFIEAENPVGSKERLIYVTNPNFKKTANIVINSIGTHVNVTHTHFSVEYQTVSIVQGGMLSFIDNDIYVPGTNLVGVLQDSVIKVYDELNWRTCGDIGVRFEKVNISNREMGDTIYHGSTLITKTVEIVDSTPEDPSQVKPGIDHINPNAISLSINNLLTGEKFNFRQQYIEGYGSYEYGKHAIMYISQNVLTFGIGALTYPCTIQRAPALLKECMGAVSEVTFILLDDLSVTSVLEFAPGIKYNFVSYGVSKKTITIKLPFAFVNSDVHFKNVDFKFDGGWTCLVLAENSNVTFTGCTVDYEDGNFRGLCDSYGLVKLALKTCTLTRNDSSDASKGNYKVNGLVFVNISSDCVNTTNIPFVDDSNRNFDSIPVSNS